MESKRKASEAYLVKLRDPRWQRRRLEIMQRDAGNKATVATILDTPLNDFQGRLLEHTESFHHAGVHVHSKIIAADPFSSDPILVGVGKFL